jgi:hypothetical protein
MKAETFALLFDAQIKRIKHLVIVKGAEYAAQAGDDRLHNFRVAARQADTSLSVANRGMDLKHRVSIDDIIENGLPAMLLTDDAKRKYIDEKITDHIIYTILLKACLLEENNLI